MSIEQPSIKNSLGKYYTELLISSAQDKYKDTKLSNFFEQRFFVQNNKAQMFIDSTVKDLSIVVSGNELQVSKSLYNHPNFTVVNSIENKHMGNTRSLYDPNNFSTISYLFCLNHTTFKITGEFDEPIYIKYKSDYETFYNSVVKFEINSDVRIEIVEEIESQCALNSTTKYMLGNSASLSLLSFYKNNLSSVSFMDRNVVIGGNANYTHTLCGKGSANIIDENRIVLQNNSTVELNGIINSNNADFHSILHLYPHTDIYKIDIDYRNILFNKSTVTCSPIISKNQPGSSTISISDVSIEKDSIPDKEQIIDFASDIIERILLERMTNVGRFYNNKSEFLSFI